MSDPLKNLSQIMSPHCLKPSNFFSPLQKTPQILTWPERLHVTWTQYLCSPHTGYPASLPWGFCSFFFFFFLSGIYSSITSLIGLFPQCLGDIKCRLLHETFVDNPLQNPTLLKLYDKTKKCITGCFIVVLLIEWDLSSLLCH